jgi:hypothetical protein
LKLYNLSPHQLSTTFVFNQQRFAQNIAPHAIDIPSTHTSTSSSLDFKSLEMQSPAIPRSIENLPSIAPSSSTVAPSLPTRGDVQDMLDIAQLDAGIRYAHVPHLAEMLQYSYQEGLLDCNKWNVDPLPLLVLHLRGERTILNQYNKHRLGLSNDKGQNNPEDDVADRLEFFPLRNELMSRGDYILHEEVLRPIYQTPPKSLVPPTPQKKMTSARETPAQATPPFGKTKSGRASYIYNKLDDAPATNLDFPTGNITIPEMAAFLPNSIKSWDAVDRLIGNGATQATYALMINTFRVMPRGQIPNNSVYRMMKGPMDKRAAAEPAYKDWTTGVHNTIAKPAGFDSKSVSVSGFRTPPDGKVTTSARPILFRDLAKGLKTKPIGFDALDLTRCVQYCEDHPNEAWMYPTDYQRILNHLGGPAPVQVQHQDAAAIARFTTARMASGAQSAFKRKRDSHGRMLKADLDEEPDYDAMDKEQGSDDEVGFDALDKGQKRKRDGSSEDSGENEFGTPSRKPAKRAKVIKSRPARKGAGKAAPPPRHASKAATLESDSDSDGFVEPTPKSKRSKQQKPVEVEAPRRSGRSNKFTKSFNVNLDDKFDDVEEIEHARPKTKISGYLGGLLAKLDRPQKPDGDSAGPDQDHEMLYVDADGDFEEEEW